jgi:PAS domain S-box-containing protein
MRKYFKSFRSSLKALIIVAILIPMIVSGLIFGIMLDNQLQAIFENRLKAGLKTLSLILTYRQQDLMLGLERIASDNTLQITLELDIASQMQKYLEYQIAVLQFSGICIADSDENVIAVAGKAGFSCSPARMQDNAISLISSEGELFFGYSVPIIRSGKPLGYAFGTMSLTNTEFRNLLQEKLVNSFIIWQNGRPAVSDIAQGNLQEIGKIPEPGRVADIQTGNHRYRTMVKEEDVSGKKLTYAVLLPLDQLKKNLQIMIVTVGGVIAVIFSVIMLFMRRFIKGLIRPVTELTTAASAIEIGSTTVPDLDFDREDEFGVLNRTFADMLHSTNKFVTELRQTQEALRKSEERYRALVDNASEAIFIVQDDVIKFPNPRAEEMMGYTAEEMAQIPYARFIDPEDKETVMARHQTLLGGKKISGSYSFRIRKRDDQKLWVLINSVHITWDGKPATLNLLADITELKQMEKELRIYQEKLELMVEERTAELKKTQKQLVSKAMEAGRAQISAMILHNIGNAVTPVIAYLDGLKNDEFKEMYRYMVKCYDMLSENSSEFKQHMVKDDRGREVFDYMGDLIGSLEASRKSQSDYIEKIESAISYISEILSLQQSYATAEHEMKANHDVNSLIEDAIRMQTGQLEKRKISVRRELDPKLSNLLIDKNRFMQVLVNLIKNSYEAIDELNGNNWRLRTAESGSIPR